MLRSSFVLALVFSFSFISASNSEMDFNGNGNGGFGGVIGGSSMTWSDDGTTVNVSFTNGNGGFGDTLVVYLDTGSAGRNVIGNDVNDRQDANRSAISWMSNTPNDLTLPSGFDASYAIAINTGFGGLWSIPSSGAIGNDGLGFIDSIGEANGAPQRNFQFFFRPCRNRINTQQRCGHQFCGDLFESIRW